MFLWRQHLLLVHLICSRHLFFFWIFLGNIETCVGMNIAFCMRKMGASGCLFIVVAAGYIHKACWVFYS